MIPDHMPSMDDPVVLQLVLCLLEAQGEKFAQLTEKPADVLPYTMVSYGWVVVDYELDGCR